MEQVKKLISGLDPEEIIKFVFHAPCGKSLYKKIIARPVVIKKTAMIQFEQFTDKQAFHKNIPLDEFSDAVINYLSGEFGKLAIQTPLVDYAVIAAGENIKIIKHKRVKTPAIRTTLGNFNLSHNKVKNYLIPENTVVEPLIDLGIFTAEGKIVKAKYDKYRQINRFLEILNDTVKDMAGEKTNEKINIVDFGCGKSYLTFIVYYFLKEIRGYDVTITGLDLKQDVVDNCNSVAKKYKYDNLSFASGDIKDYIPGSNVDIVICLHACDTASDYALFNALKWKVKAILAVPCCQHEVNAQINTDKFSMLTRYGAVKERIAALMTDAVRAGLLEFNGYGTQILEFVDFSHSPKNLLIKAVKKNVPGKEKEKIRKEIDALLDEYKIYPALCGLLDWRGGA